ncbi:hypothetical protein QB781_003922 [Salmonella enterica]|nr:hypothetical protein [Salmonella enterica]EIP6687077.1 hypothetical protein [Salmonella enterica subsp. enterica serovar Javiana]EIP6742423.1 hypothetical protein [Salmonella enterica subsp. enterica serovar Javiana]EIQ4670383.1 hypothetical protein [Salmonella enterica subsp. enterica serovar Javiana]EIR2402422.1 hypothetical protein [Salmonella enterica subsp. enterica serovar Javiana]
MKRTRWLFYDVISIALLSSLAISADLNAAPVPIKGDMTYSQKINPRPCTIKNAEQSQTLPDYSRLDILEAGGGVESITEQIGAMLRGGSLTYTFGIDCPSEITEVNVKAVYTNANLFKGKPILATSGSGKGVALWVYPVSPADGATYWLNDTAHLFSLPEGKGNVGLKIVAYPGYQKKTEIASGDYKGVIDLVFDFVGG